MSYAQTMFLVVFLLICGVHRAAIVQRRGIGQIPDIDYNMDVAGGNKECVHVIAEGELRRLYVFVRFDDLGEVQASIKDFYISIRIVNDDISLDSIDHACFQIGGYNFFESDCEYFGEWPEARIFTPDDNPLEVANYYLDFSDLIFGRPGVNGSSSTYEFCAGNGWQSSEGAVRYSGFMLFSDSELTLTGLPPTAAPTPLPTHVPSAAPSGVPSHEPTAQPTSSSPTIEPSISTGSPTAFDYIAPTAAPSISTVPSSAPSTSPSTAFPTSSEPSVAPSHNPSHMPTYAPSFHPTVSPTATFAPSATPLRLDSTCGEPLSLAVTASLAAYEEQCLLVPMSGITMTSINISLLFTRQVDSFTESPSDLAVIIVNTANGDGVQVGGSTLVDDRVSRLLAWPSSWHHMHVAAGVSSKFFSALVDLSSFQMGGDHVYNVCLRNSYFFSAGVHVDGGFNLGDMVLACNIELPVPSAPPSLAPSLSLAPSQGKKQELLMGSITGSGIRPAFTFDALLSGGERVCVETSALAGAPSSIRLELTASYPNDDPGASWASDLVVSVSSSVNGSYDASDRHCAHITGEGTSQGIASCAASGTWPPQMNSGISGLQYSNISAHFSLSSSVSNNLDSFGPRQVCIGNNYLASDNVRYEGTLTIDGMFSALPPTMAPTISTITVSQSKTSNNQLLSPSNIIIGIAAVVVVFLVVLGGTYWYRHGKIIYHKGDLSGGHDIESGSANNDSVLEVTEWPQLEVSFDVASESSSLEINLEDEMEESDHDHDIRLFTALRKKKEELNIQEAQSNTKKLSALDRLRRKGGVAPQSGQKPGLIPPPGAVLPEANLSSFFDDVTYGSGDSPRSSYKESPRNDSVMPFPLFESDAPSQPNTMATITPRRQFTPIDRSRSNNSEDMGLIFDPFANEQDMRSEISEGDLSRCSSVSVSSGIRTETLDLFGELGANMMPLDNQPLDSLKDYPSTSLDLINPSEEAQTVAQYDDNILTAEFLLGEDHDVLTSSSEGEKEVSEAVALQQDKEVEEEEQQTMKVVGEFHIFSDEENDKPFHL